MSIKKDLFGLGRDTLIYGVGGVVIRFINLITLPLFTFYITPKEYGVLAMLALLGMVAQPFFSLGLPAAMGQCYFQKENLDNKLKVTGSAFLISIISASSLVFISWNFPVALGELVQLSPEYSYLVSLSLTGTALTVLSTSLSQTLQFEKQSKLYISITIITTLTALLISGYSVVLHQGGAQGIIFGQVAGNATSCLLFILYSFKKKRFKISFPVILELICLGIPLVPSFAFLFVLEQSNKYILQLHSGLESVGNYSIGYNLGMSISIVTTGLASAWYPFFMTFQGKKEIAKMLFGRIFTYYIIFVGTLCAFYFIFSKPAVDILVNTQFHSSSVVVGFVALSNFCSMMFNLFLPALYFEKKVKHVTLIQGMAALAGIPICYSLINTYGLLGSALAIFCNNALMATLLFYWNKVVLKTKFKVKYEWKRVIVASISLTTIVVLYNLFAPFFDSSLACSTLFGCLCLPLAFLLLTTKERTSIISFTKDRLYHG